MTRIVNDDDAIWTKVRENILRLCDGDDFGEETVAMAVVLPHADEVLRANDERFQRARRVLENAGQRGGHERFSQADDIPQQHAPPFFQVAGRDLNRGFLERE